MSNQKGSLREEGSGSRSVIYQLTHMAKLSMPTPIRVTLSLIQGGIHSTLHCTNMVLTKQLNMDTIKKIYYLILKLIHYPQVSSRQENL